MNSTRKIFFIVFQIIFILFDRKQCFCSNSLCKKDLDIGSLYKYKESAFTTIKDKDENQISQGLLKETVSAQSAETEDYSFSTLSTYTENVLMQIKKDKDGRIPVERPDTSIFKYHAFLDLKFPGNNFCGSGTLVGPRHIITAGHNVFGINWVDEIDVFLSLDGSKKPFGKQRVIQVHTYREWVENLNKVFDIALLVLDSPIGLNVGWISMKALLNPLDIEITVAGYPGFVDANKVEEEYREEARKMSNNYRKMWMMSGPLTGFERQKIKYEIDTSKGQSGSAIFYCDKDGIIYVIGVHTYGVCEDSSDNQNSGTRITERILTDFVEIISKTSVVEKYGVALFLDFLDLLKMLRLIHPNLYQAELQMPVPMIDQTIQTYGDGRHHHMEIKVQNFNELCSLAKFQGDETARYIKSILEETIHKTLFINYICDSDMAVKIEQIFFKKNKTLEDIKELGKYFCWGKGSLLAFLNADHNKGEISDQGFYDYIRTYQVVLLYILNQTYQINYQFDRQDLLLLEHAETTFKEEKKSIIETLVISYRKGCRLLDEARRFWRDDHKTVGERCSLVLPVLSATNYQDRYIENQQQSYLTALYTLIHEHYLVVIHGAGGMGKSTLARAYAEEAMKNNAYGFIGWFNAENDDTLRESLLNAIKEFDRFYSYNEKDTNKDLLWDLEEKCREKSIADRNRLFIFDNAADYKSIQGIVRPFKHTIVTTRTDPGGFVSSLKLDVFSDSEAYSYVKNVLKDKSPTDDDIKRLCERLGNHPLALSVACGYIKDKKSTKKGTSHRKMNIETFMQEYDSLFKTIVEIPGGCDKSLYTTLQLSVKKLSPEEKNLFFKLCYLSPDNIKPDLLGDYSNVVDILWTLGDENLIRIDCDDNIITSLSLHRLTQEVGRYIFEGEDKEEKKEIFNQLKESFFDKLLIELEDYALSIKQSLENCTLSVEQLSSTYQEIRFLKIAWKTLNEHISRHKGLLLDKDAYFCRLIQADLALKLLQIDPTQEEHVIAEQTQLTRDDYIKMMIIYDDHFSSITDPVQKKQIFIRLAKFYKGNFSKYIDWSFFEGLPFKDIWDRLDILVSTTNVENFDLNLFFQKAREHIDAFKSDPYLTLVAVRFKQQRAMGTPYVYDEVIQFLQKLSTKHFSYNLYLYERVLSAFVKLPPHLCSILEKFRVYDENTINALLQFSNPALISFMTPYINMGQNALGEFDDPHEATLFIEGFRDFVKLIRDVQNSFAVERFSSEEDFKTLCDTYPNCFTVVRHFLPGNDEVDDIDLLAYAMQNDNITDAYLNMIINLTQSLKEKNVSNLIFAFNGFLKHFKTLMPSTNFGETQDGKDDFLYLESCSKIKNILKDEARRTLIQSKLKEYFDLEQTQPDMKTHDYFEIIRVMDKIYDKEELFKTIWENFCTIDMKDIKPSEKIHVLEWYFDHPESLEFIQRSFPLYLKLGYKIEDILEFYDFYKHHSIDLTKEQLDRFSKVENYFPTDAHEQCMLAMYLPLICEKRLNLILSHPFLKSSFLTMSFSSLIAAAATMDTKFCINWLQENPRFQTEKNLWDSFLENMFNVDFSTSYALFLNKLVANKT